MRLPGALAVAAAVIVLLLAPAAAQDCPVQYAGQSKPLLFGGLYEGSTVCKLPNGQSCARTPKW